MLSGVISTLERIFANGFEGADGAPRTGVFRPLVRAVGLVGVPGEGLEAGLTPGAGAHTTHLCCSSNARALHSGFPQEQLSTSKERLKEATPCARDRARPLGAVTHTRLF